MRWQRCSILTPLVINKVHIGPQFEYIISKRLSVYKTLFHSAHHVLKLIKSQQFQQATTSSPSIRSLYIAMGNTFSSNTTEALIESRQWN